MSKKTEPKTTSGETVAAEITSADLDKLRSLQTSVLRQDKALRKFTADLNEETRKVLAEAPPSERGNENATREHIGMTRRLNGVSADYVGKLEKLKADAAELLSLAQRIGKARNPSLMDAYEKGVSSAAKAIRPFCEDDKEAGVLARATSQLQTLHERMFGWNVFGINIVNKATATTDGILREMAEPIPSFA